MRALSAQDLLEIWEWGQVQSLTRRALGVLAAAFPDVAPEHLETLSVGGRDRALLLIRESLFGPTLPCVADCPACREPVAMDLETVQLCGGHEPVGATVPVSDEFPPLVVEGVEVWWRLPDSRDLLALESAADPDDARSRLLRRTIVAARRGEQGLEVEDLPEGVVAGVVEAIEQADPQARIDLDLTCPGCGHRWLVLFDAPAYLWSEIDTRTRRLLYEVHQLASAYGWREADILALSERRRWAYLEMLGA